MSLRATILGQRREAFAQLLRLIGKLSYPDHPLPRLTTAQNEIMNDVLKLVSALLDLDKLEEDCFEKKVQLGMENITVPPLPFILPIHRLPEEQPPGPEIDCVSSIEAVNQLLASGQWEFKQAVPLTGYLLSRKPYETTNEEESESGNP